MGELLGRADVEGLAGERVDLARHRVEAPLELLGESFEPFDIHADPRPLHARQHRHEGALDVVVDRLERKRLELRLRVRPVAPEPASALAEALGQLGVGQLGRVVQGRGAVDEYLHADLVERVREPRRVQEVRGHRAVVHRGRLVAARQHPLDHGLRVVDDQLARAEQG